MTKGVDELLKLDPYLVPFEAQITARAAAVHDYRRSLMDSASLQEISSQHDYFGLHKTNHGWVFREYAPNATKIFIWCEKNNWQDSVNYELTRSDDGIWEITLTSDQLAEQDIYKLHVHWPGGSGQRLPTYTGRAVQDDETKIFCAEAWVSSYTFKHEPPQISAPLFIYEAHIGMSSENEGVSTFGEFRDNVLPHVHSSGYNVLQIMAVQEHPYYGSFGYHVSNLFAVSSRFGTPDELKSLIDTAHGLGIAVIIDLVHSHAVKNEQEGLGLFDGTDYLYFHSGDRGLHPAWDSRCYDYSKKDTAKLLLSNCRYWLEEYNLDGFRFDGVTSMLYTHHGLGKDFTSYHDYFEHTDQDAYSYLSLANELIQIVRPGALSIAEEMSGMPGLVWPSGKGGAGFTHRLSMGMPDMWIKLLKETADEDWDIAHILHELTQHRAEEATISYAESHDQALVGDKTIIFRLIDKDMYEHMSIDKISPLVERGVALHKIIRLLSASTHSGGYLNFMGNEFGHPEWIDFPREGNGWSYKYARRQWSLLDNDSLAYKWLYGFDVAMIGILKRATVDISHHHADQANMCASYVRGEYLFVYNLNSQRSLTDHSIPTPDGRYELILSSDAPEYGGFGHVSSDAPYVASDGHLKTYIPARSALVFRLEV
ncbi:MAG: alpha-amylase family glycosyl hydrolase [Patescibacteria group bacterium]